jgi:hypothetical protein
VAGWIIQRVAEVDAAKQAATAAEISELRSHITDLAQMVSDLRNDRGDSAAN